MDLSFTGKDCQIKKSIQSRDLNEAFASELFHLNY